MIIIVLTTLFLHTLYPRFTYALVNIRFAHEIIFYKSSKSQINDQILETAKIISGFILHWILLISSDLFVLFLLFFICSRIVEVIDLNWNVYMIEILSLIVLSEIQSFDNILQIVSHYVLSISNLENLN